MLIILLLSILGFLNAYFLHYQYQQYLTSGKQMFCLMGGKCADVVSSKFGQTLGIKNELIGMTYYVLLSAYSLGSIFVPQLGEDLGLWAKIVVILATVFSLYLLYAQTFILRQFCSWCLIAISINILIFYFLMSI